MNRISEEKIKSAKRRTRLTAAVFAISLTCLIPVLQSFITAFHESGFWQFASLIITDMDVIGGLWQDLALSLAESVPVWHTIFTLGAVFAMLGSLRLLGCYMKILFNTSARQLT